MMLMMMEEPIADSYRFTEQKFLADGYQIYSK